MDYVEFRRHLGKAGLKVNEFSALIDVQPTSISLYANKMEIPTKYAVVAVLLGDAADRKLDFRKILARYGITWRMPRSEKKVASFAEYRGRPKR